MIERYHMTDAETREELIEALLVYATSALTAAENPEIRHVAFTVKQWRRIVRELEAGTEVVQEATPMFSQGLRSPPSTWRQADLPMLRGRLQVAEDTLLRGASQAARLSRALLTIDRLTPREG